MHAFTVDEVDARRQSSGEPWLEFERSESLSTGLYVLQSGERDRQTPHDEDEIYVVMSGTARFVASGDAVDVAPGSVLFVPAHEPHRFEDVSGPLSLVVVFAPPESSDGYRCAFNPMRAGPPTRRSPRRTHRPAGPARAPRPATARR